MSQRARDTFLGLDIGTSSVKALLIDADQRVVAEGSTPLSVSRPLPLWSEQDPPIGLRALWRRSPRSAAMPPGIRGPVGHRPFRPDAWRDLARREDQPLRPAILWNDGRSFAECAELKRAFPISISGPETWPCRASPRPRCCGSPRMSRKSPSRRNGCCCPRTTCACASRAKPSPRCPTPPERCGLMSGGGAGTTTCSPRPA